MNNLKRKVADRNDSTTVRKLYEVDAGVLSSEAGMLRWIILAAAILLILFGIFRDETTVVLRKAATICLECIGIG